MWDMNDVIRINYKKADIAPETLYNKVKSLNKNI